MTNLLEQARHYLNQRRRAYITTFKNPVGEIVLADLARFCRASQSTFHTDERTHALLEGRREVFLRIQQHLNLSEDDLWRLLNSKG
jgi:hypothetical protein